MEKRYAGPDVGGQESVGGIEHDLAETSTQDRGQAETFSSERRSSSPKSKLRTRIMATSYRYKLLDEENKLSFVDDPGHRQRECLFCRSPHTGVIILILLVLVIGLIIGLGIALVRARDAKVEVCSTPECVDLSAYIMNKMNSSIDPCKDMYQYSCGGWLAKTDIPLGYTRWTQFAVVSKKNQEQILTILNDNTVTLKGVKSTAVTKLRKLFRSCMDLQKIEEVGTKPLLKLIEQAGSWTITTDGSIAAWDKGKWVFQDVFEKVQQLEATPLFSPSIGPDSRNTSRNAITLNQAGLTLADKSEYVGNSSEEIKEAYLNFATTVGVLLGGDKTDTRKIMSDVYDLETQIAKITVPRENFSDPFAIYNKMTISEFQSLTGSWIDVKKLLKAVYTGKMFLDSDEVIVLAPSYFEQLGSVIKSTKAETLANYFMWVLVQNSIPYLPESFARAALLLSKVESGLSSLEPRSEFCVSKVHSSLGMAASGLYVEKHFSSASKKQVSSLIDEIIKQFVKNLDKVEWLDTPTRDLMRDKAMDVTHKVGYPDWILDASKLDDHYAQLKIEEGNLFANWLHIIDFYRQIETVRLGKPPDKAEWLMNPDQVNAYYDPIFNQMVIPAGILQEPFYSPKFPAPMLYGSIGVVVGHELTHGFDNQGRLYNKMGNLDNLWTAFSTKNFNRKAQCMVEQYNKYSLHDIHMNGKLTLGENIADNGGTHIAFAAYKAKYQPSLPLTGLPLSDDQMFFLGFSQLWCTKSTILAEKMSVLTDVHSLGQFRVQGVCSNHLWFSRAYECEQDALYNPTKKCHVW